MPRTLIVYASTHGHTAKIARRLADAVRAAGADVDLRQAGAAALAPRGYDGVIAGGSIHHGHHQRELVEWARHHAVELSQIRRSAFFSVCLAVADESDESAAAARGYIDLFADDTGWTPDATTTFAGALQYLEYDFMTRLAIRLMMRHGGHPTDTTRDFEFTDWDAVERFGREFADALAPRA